MRGVQKEERNRLSKYYAEEVGLGDFLEKYPSHLSGGMQQRAALVRAFANEPKVLLMDEPFASVDAQTSYRMQVLLNKVWEKNPKTIIFVTHNVDEAIFLSDRIIFLTQRPSRIATEILVEIPRPRDYSIFKELAVIEMRDKILGMIFAVDK
jgi:NitT/TauT family transport system ATP-binding protein